mgnify:CR=1 FL=1
MAPRAISVAAIGAICGFGLAASMVAADQPEPAQSAGTTQEAVRNQIQAKGSNGYGEPLAAARLEVGQQSRRQLGPGDNSGSGTTSRKAKGAEQGRGGQDNGSMRSRTSGVGAQRSTAPALQRLRMRDPNSGCSGMMASSRQNGSSGQRRGGGRR